MKTTTHIIDEDIEYQYLRDENLLKLERLHQEGILMREIFSHPQVFLGKTRRLKDNEYGGRKTSRIISNIQHKYGRLQAASRIWNRSKSPVRSGMPF